MNRRELNEVLAPVLNWQVRRAVEESEACREVLIDLLALPGSYDPASWDRELKRLDRDRRKVSDALDELQQIALAS